MMGIPLPILWGLLSFITNYIPYIGFWLGLTSRRPCMNCSKAAPA